MYLNLKNQSITEHLRIWWGKLLSIIIGFSWILSGNKSKETNE